MLEKLIEIAKEKGISGFTGVILANNKSMLHIIKKLPYNIHFKSYAGEFEFQFKFDDYKETTDQESSENESKK